MKKIYYVVLVMSGCVFFLEAQRAPKASRSMEKKIASTLQLDNLTPEAWDALINLVRTYIYNQYRAVDNSQKHVFKNGFVAIGHAPEGRSILPESLALEQLEKIAVLGHQAIFSDVQVKNLQRRKMLSDKALQQLKIDVAQIVALLPELEKSLARTGNLSDYYLQKRNVAEVLVRLISSLHNAVIPETIYSQ